MQTYPEACILDVNLTTGELKKTTIPGEVYRLYPGGAALGAYLIMREGMDPKVDPLSPEALLVFAVSPTTGLPFSGNSRMNITAKSPLTGTLGDSQGGGYFPAQLRSNGYDAVLFRGCASSPKYLYIDNEDVQLRDASFIWGASTLETEELIKKEHEGERLEIAEIGPAGENLVRFACVLSNATHANGRNGMGAVMGSKKLKAVACRKQKPRKPYDPEGFKRLFGNVAADIAANATLAAIHEHGTAVSVTGNNNAGYLITRNCQSGYFPEAEQIDGREMTRTILKGRGSCYACAVRCKREVEIPEKGRGHRIRRAGI